MILLRTILAFILLLTFCLEANSQDIVLSTSPQHLNILPGCQSDKQEKEVGVYTNTHDTVKLYSFKTNYAKCEIFSNGKKINATDTFDLTASNPLCLTLHFESTPAIQDRPYEISFESSIDSIEALKKNEIGFWFADFLIGNEVFWENNLVTVELLKSCLDSIKVYFPVGGTETTIALFKSKKSKKPIKTTRYEFGYPAKNYMTFTRKDIGRYFVTVTSCHLGTSFWLHVK